MDRNELKVQALLEKISSLTTNYENQIADLRVEVTLASNELQAMGQELENLRGEKGQDEVSEEEAPADDEG